MGSMNVVAHNLQAMFSDRELGITNKAKAKSTEKLSSGYKINRAADDAAGLTISEEMRRQIRGLDRGADNIQDGISFLQVADGALEEVNDMLHRIEELSVQAANGTNSQQDRKAINEEVDAILAEIDRIGVETKFNERKVFLQGHYTVETTLATPTATSKFFSLFSGEDISKTGYMQEPLDKDTIIALNTVGQGTGYHNQGNNDYVGVHINFKKLFDDNKVGELAGTSFYVNCCTHDCPCEISFADQVGITKKGNDVTIGIRDSTGNLFSDAETFLKYIVTDHGQEIKASHVEYAYEDSTLYIYDIDNNTWSESSKRSAYFCDVPGTGGQFSIGPDPRTLHIHMRSEAEDGLDIPLYPLNSNVLKLDSQNCLTEENAEHMIDALEYANQLIGTMRSMNGAYTNRLEHAYNTNTNTFENTSAAESQIRDTDMAMEMVKFASLNILQQTGQSMLAQANQSKQGILQLLQ